MQNSIIKNIDELKLQKEVHFYISEPSRIYSTLSGRRLQIISPGRLNHEKGPDFLNTALLIDGFLVIGSCEFHKKSSDWIYHNHDEDINYKNVVLHIVLKNDVKIENSFETLVLDYDSVSSNIRSNSQNETEFIFSQDEIQNLALHRLLRKTCEAKKMIDNCGLPTALAELTGAYISRYEQKRNRHQYSSERLQKIAEGINSSSAAEFLTSLSVGKEINIHDTVAVLLKKPIIGEGTHLRREIILNVIFPLAMAVADDESRIDLFVWYWSIPCLNIYSILKRKFPELQQNFLWQQQGMLEYIRQFGSKNSIASELLYEYGFAEILSFYKLGRIPLELQSKL